jgi:citrate synthase
MEYIKYRFFQKASKCSKEFQRIKNEYSDKVIAEVTLGQVFSGMKGIPLLVTDTSKLDPNEGIRFKGYSIPELREKLPKMSPDGEPLPEGLFYLMLIGEIPTQEDVSNLSKDFATRAHVPQHVFDVIDAMPKNSRPMTQFSAAILVYGHRIHFSESLPGRSQQKILLGFVLRRCDEPDCTLAPSCRLHLPP